METATTIFIVVATIVAESLLERVARDARRLWKNYQVQTRLAHEALIEQRRSEQGS